MEMKKLIGILALLLVVIGPAFSVAENPLGTTLYSVTYTQVPDLSGVYHSEILRYSDLSTTDSNIKILFIAEQTQLGEGGNISASVSLQKANGTNLITTYTKDYAFDFETNPLNFYVDLNKGDNALVVFYNVDSNITNLQIVRNENAPRIPYNSNSWLDSFASGFVTLWAFETNFVDSLQTPFYIGFMLLEIIIIPTLFILILAWSFRKVRESMLK